MDNGVGIAEGVMGRLSRGEEKGKIGVTVVT